MAVRTRIPITAEEYERLALAEPDRKWELVDGHPREKPGMTFAHNEVEIQLGYMLMAQLDRSMYHVRIDAGRLRRPGATYFIPDIFVFPVSLVTPRLRQDDVLEVYDDPVPLVVEVWSRSTGDYDVGEKLTVYKQRGDSEIWLVHPYERTVTAWVRQSDGSYTETVYREGVVSPSALPGVTIDLAALFDG
jgi:Uma2 family endonuclease